METLKIILVDDNEAFRKVFRQLLISKYHAEIIGEASNAEEFKSLKNIHLADLIFMDVMMPGTDGITLTKHILWQFSHLKIIAITMHSDKIYLKSLLEAGFKGCIYKNNLFKEIANAINTVLDKHLYFPNDIMIEQSPKL